FETYINDIRRGQNDKVPYENKKDISLLIEFVSGEAIYSIDSIRRNHGEAMMISEIKKSSLNQGDRSLFITVLTPHDRTADVKSIAGKLKVQGIVNDTGAISLIYNNKTRLSYKLDLDYGIHPYEEDRAPAYDWETGKIEYGEITTDADFAYLIDRGGKCDYGMFNGCRLHYNDMCVYETPRYTTRDFLVEKFKEIDHKWRCWSGSADLSDRGE
ncbi:MAG: hypothetical protein R3232_12425, partial [Clostridia bacterium]|nr:hypothetical protein [Clostridia bacterium]